MDQWELFQEAQKRGLLKPEDTPLLEEARKRGLFLSPFQKWYAEGAPRWGLDEDPYNPEHYYDYEAAYNAGERGPDASGHWPSKYKKPGHPRETVDGINTRTGEPVSRDTVLSPEQVTAFGDQMQAREEIPTLSSATTKPEPEPLTEIGGPKQVMGISPEPAERTVPIPGTKEFRAKLDYALSRHLEALGAPEVDQYTTLSETGKPVARAEQQLKPGQYIGPAEQWSELWGKMGWGGLSFNRALKMNWWQKGAKPGKQPGPFGSGVPKEPVWDVQRGRWDFTPTEVLDKAKDIRLSPQLATQRFKDVGVAEKELKALGWPEFVKDKPFVTPRMVEQFYEQNKGKVEVGEVVRGEWKPTDEWVKRSEQVSKKLEEARKRYTELEKTGITETGNVQDIMRLEEEARALSNQQHQATTKFAQHSHPGGENYREISLTAPESSRALTDSDRGAIQGEIDAIDRKLKDTRTPLQEAGDLMLVKAKLQEQLQSNKMIQAYPDFKGAHSEIPNEIAIIRMSDRTLPSGEVASLLDETQSDWALESRRHKKGIEYFVDDGAVPGRFIVRSMLNGEPTEDTIAEYRSNREAREHVERLNEESSIASIPPLLEKWHDLAFRRAIFDAVQKGHTRLLWSTGQQIADRYDLSKHVESLTYYPKEQRLDMELKDGSTNTVSDPVPPEKLADWVGKEVAERLLAAKLEPLKADIQTRRAQTLRGLDLKVGGEWAKRLYDENFGNKAKKLTKIFGGKVEDVLAPVDAKGATTFIDQPENLDMQELDIATGEVIKRIKSLPPNHPNWPQIKTLLGFESSENMEGTDWDEALYEHVDYHPDVLVELNKLVGTPPGLQTFHSLTITPELSNAIKEQGFEPFSDWEKLKPQRGPGHDVRDLNKKYPPVISKDLPEAAVKAEAQRLGVEYGGYMGDLQNGHPVYTLRDPQTGTNFSPGPGETLEEALQRARERMGAGPGAQTADPKLFGTPLKPDERKALEALVEKYKEQGGFSVKQARELLPGLFEGEEADRIATKVLGNLSRKAAIMPVNPRTYAATGSYKYKFGVSPEVRSLLGLDPLPREEAMKQWIEGRRQGFGWVYEFGISERQENARARLEHLRSGYYKVRMTGIAPAARAIGYEGRVNQIAEQMLADKIVTKESLKFKEDLIGQLSHLRRNLPTVVSPLISEAMNSIERLHFEDYEGARTTLSSIPEVLTAHQQHLRPRLKDDLDLVLRQLEEGPPIIRRRSWEEEAKAWMESSWGAERYKKNLRRRYTEPIQIQRYIAWLLREGTPVTPQTVLQRMRENMWASLPRGKALGPLQDAPEKVINQVLRIARQEVQTEPIPEGFEERYAAAYTAALQEQAEQQTRRAEAAARETEDGITAYTREPGAISPVSDVIQRLFKLADDKGIIDYVKAKKQMQAQFDKYSTELGKVFQNRPTISVDELRKAQYLLGEHKYRYDWIHPVMPRDRSSMMRSMYPEAPPSYLQIWAHPGSVAWRGGHSYPASARQRQIPTVGWFRVVDLVDTWMVEEIQSDLLAQNLDRIQDLRKQLLQSQWEIVIDAENNVRATNFPSREAAMEHARELVTDANGAFDQETYDELVKSIQVMDLKARNQAIDALAAENKYASDWADYGLATLLKLAREAGVKGVMIADPEAVKKLWSGHLGEAKSTTYYKDLPKRFGFELGAVEMQTTGKYTGKEKFSIRVPIFIAIAAGAEAARRTQKNREQNND